jgi:hypothetical protein
MPARTIMFLSLLLAVSPAWGWPLPLTALGLYCFVLSTLLLEDPNNGKY